MENGYSSFSLHPNLRRKEMQCFTFSAAKGSILSRRGVIGVASHVSASAACKPVSDARATVTSDPSDTGGSVLQL